MIIGTENVFVLLWCLLPGGWFIDLVPERGAPLTDDESLYVTAVILPRPFRLVVFGVSPGEIFCLYGVAVLTPL